MNTQKIKGKILIVDDSESLRESLKIFLHNSHYLGIGAENGQAALDILEQSQNLSEDYLLIILDVNMPVMDGITFCEKAFEKGITGKIPIIMLTTEAREELKEKARELGVRAWVTKPFVPEKLLMGIEKMLKKDGRL
jgi:two-component system chemotaxis response regulator CheY